MFKIGLIFLVVASAQAGLSVPFRTTPIERQIKGAWSVQTRSELPVRKDPSTIVRPAKVSMESCEIGLAVKLEGQLQTFRNLGTKTVMSEWTDQATIEEYKMMLARVNHTINRMYQMMDNQKDRDTEFVNMNVKQFLDTIRTKRDAPQTETKDSETLDKMKNAFDDFQGSFKNLWNNLTSTDAYKKVKEFGEELGEKTKEIVNNMSKSFNSTMSSS